MKCETDGPLCCITVNTKYCQMYLVRIQMGAIVWEGSVEIFNKPHRGVCFDSVIPF